MGGLDCCSTRPDSVRGCRRRGGRPAPHTQDKITRAAQPEPSCSAVAHAQLVANSASGDFPARSGRTPFHLRPPGGAAVPLLVANGACARPGTLLRLRGSPSPCGVLLGLCFRREGYRQDGAAGAGLSAHQARPLLRPVPRRGLRSQALQ